MGLWVPQKFKKLSSLRPSMCCIKGLYIVLLSMRASKNANEDVFYCVYLNMCLCAC